MKYNSPLFVEYTEIRRRIERRFANTHIVIGHVIVFALASIATGGWQSPGIYYYGYRSSFSLGIIILLWSFVLLGHGLWVYRRSAALAKAREAAINQQIE